jgi:hypothetical protein
VPFSTGFVESQRKVSEMDQEASSKGCLHEKAPLIAVVRRESHWEGIARLPRCCPVRGGSAEKDGGMVYLQ